MSSSTRTGRRLLHCPCLLPSSGTAIEGNVELLQTGVSCDVLLSACCGMLSKNEFVGGAEDAGIPVAGTMGAQEAVAEALDTDELVADAIEAEELMDGVDVNTGAVYSASSANMLSIME